jgi:hypothetical protein
MPRRRTKRAALAAIKGCTLRIWEWIMVQLSSHKQDNRIVVAPIIGYAVTLSIVSVSNYTIAPKP